MHRRKFAAASCGALLLAAASGQVLVAAGQVTLSTLVTDVDGVAVSGVTVLAAPPEHPMNVLGTTDATGRFIGRWRTAAWPSDVLVELEFDGRSLFGVARLRAHEARPGGGGGEVELEVILDPTFTASRGPLVLDPAEEGQGVRAWDRRKPVGFEEFEEEPEFYAEDLAQHLLDSAGRRGRMRRDAPRWAEDGTLRFVAGSPMSELPLDTESDPFQEPVAAPPPAYGWVVGRATDEAGGAAAGLRFEARDSEGRTLASTTADASGVYRLRADAPELLVYAGLGPLQRPRSPAQGAWTKVRCQPSGEVTWDPTVRRGPAVSATPPPGLHVALACRERTESGERLRVAIAGAGRARGLHAGSADVFWVDPQRQLFCGADLTPVPGAWVGSETGLSPVDVLVHDESGPAATELGVLDTVRGFGVRTSTRGERGERMAELLRLAPGTYEVSLGWSDGQWTESRAVRVEAGAPTVLGPFRYGPAAWFELPVTATDDTQRTVELERLHRGVWSLVVPHSWAPERRNLRRTVPPGAYRLHSQGVDPVALDLKPGETYRVSWY